jgi:hypothetical protein
LRGRQNESIGRPIWNNPQTFDDDKITGQQQRMHFRNALIARILLSLCRNVTVETMFSTVGDVQIKMQDIGAAYDEITPPQLLLRLGR